MSRIMTETSHDSRAVTVRLDRHCQALLDMNHLDAQHVFGLGFKALEDELRMKPAPGGARAYAEWRQYAPGWDALTPAERATWERIATAGR